MKPPGGESSDLFGSPEEGISSSKPNRMASNIFGPTEEPKNIPKRTNPPGVDFILLTFLALNSIFFLKICLTSFCCYHETPGPKHINCSSLEGVRTRIQARAEADVEIMEECCLLACSSWLAQLAFL
jgi:hypothetical protein